jgi:hypothetical protein
MKKKSRLLLLVLGVLLVSCAIRSRKTMVVDSVQWEFVKQLVDVDTGQVVNEKIVYGGIDDPIPAKHPFVLAYEADPQYRVVEYLNLSVIYIGNGQYYGYENMPREDWDRFYHGQQCILELSGRKVTSDSCMK